MHMNVTLRTYVRTCTFKWINDFSSDTGLLEKFYFSLNVLPCYFKCHGFVLLLRLKTKINTKYPNCLNFL